MFLMLKVLYVQEDLEVCLLAYYTEDILKGNEMLCYSTYIWIITTNFENLCTI